MKIVKMADKKLCGKMQPSWSYMKVCDKCLSTIREDERKRILELIDELNLYTNRKDDCLLFLDIKEELIQKIKEQSSHKNN